MSHARTRTLSWRFALRGIEKIRWKRKVASRKLTQIAFLFQLKRQLQLTATEYEDDEEEGAQKNVKKRGSSESAASFFFFCSPAEFPCPVLP